MKLLRVHHINCLIIIFIDLKENLIEQARLTFCQSCIFNYEFLEFNIFRLAIIEKNN